MGRNGSRWLRNRPLAGFFVLTFGISWGVPAVALAAATVLPLEVTLAGYSPLAYLVVWAPAIAAFAMIGLQHGRDGVRAYLQRVTEVTGSFRWYVAVLVGVPVVYLVAALAVESTGGTPVTLSPGWVTPFVVLSVLRLTQGPVEEFGWRGFALPLLQRRYSGLGAALVLGFVWALWHTPALVVSAAEFQPGGNTLAVDLVQVFLRLLATSVIVTVVFNGTDGSVPLAVLFHWLTNLPYPWETGAGTSLLQDVLTAVVAVIVVAALGRQYLGRTNLVTRVLPKTEPGREHTGVGVEPSSVDGGERG